jgi:hypothetical protein
MNIQDLRDIVAQINAAHPTENSEFPLLLEGKGGWLNITFTSHNGIKIRLCEYTNSEEDWVAIASFYELSEMVWKLSKNHPDDALVFITPDDRLLKVDCEGTDDYFGDTVEWLEDLPLEIFCIFAYFYPLKTKDFKPWSRIVRRIMWNAEELVEALELLFFDEDEFETYHECSIAGRDWYHMQASALLARQNTANKQAKYPALCGINVSAVNDNLELSAMCPTATTYRLIWHDNRYWDNFSFTIPVELVDQIPLSIDVSKIEYVKFAVNPELIQVKVNYQQHIVMDGVAAKTGTAYFYASPLQGRYWYPKVPINQVTEKSAVIEKSLLQEAISSAIADSKGFQRNEVLLQVQDEQLFVHGLGSSFQLDSAECVGVPDNQIRVCAIQLLDMLKYVPDHTTLFLDFPDRVTQALMIGTATGIQYLVFGLIKGDRTLSSDSDITELLLTIPGIIPSEPDLVLQLTEQPLLEPPLPEEEALSLKEDLMQTYGLLEDWDYYAAIDEMCEQLIDAQEILEKYKCPPEGKALVSLIKETLSDYDYATTEYQSGETADLYYHGGLCRKDLEAEIDAIKEIASSINLFAGRIKEDALKIEKTYRVKMTFA